MRVFRDPVSIVSQSLPLPTSCCFLIILQIFRCSRSILDLLDFLPTSISGSVHKPESINEELKGGWTLTHVHAKSSMHFIEFIDFLPG
jgi:hypothetical protein